MCIHKYWHNMYVYVNNYEKTFLFDFIQILKYAPEKKPF